MNRTYNVRFLREKEFDGIIELGNRVFGDNYLNQELLEEYLKRSTKDGINCSFSLTLNEGDEVPERVIGFRITWAPGSWIDSYEMELHPEEWGFDPEKVAYMKSNCLDEEFRGSGFGRMLLDRAIAETKRQGAEAALAHIWMHSPGNSAFRYFSRAGGKLVREYPGYWVDFHGEDSPCVRCGAGCQCTCAEMILDFANHEELGNV
jgi:ribosomal protein S18 acetylase RimI-like enzyme